MSEQDRLQRVLRALDESGDGTISMQDLFLMREAQASIALDKDEQVQTLHHDEDVER